MHRFVTVIFPDKEMASAGNRALKDFGTNEVTIYASAVIFKDANGNIAIAERSDSGSHVTAIAALIGGLAGLPAGPLGVAMGAVGGGMIGFSAKTTDRESKARFLQNISQQLISNKAALVVDLDDTGLPFFDAQMKDLGGMMIAQE